MLNLVTTSINHSFAILALGLFSLTLVPSSVNQSWLQTTQLSWINNIWKIRPQILAIGLFLALVHGLMMTQVQGLDFSSMKTYWLYAEGITTFNIFVLMAFTYKEMQQEGKKLRYFAYVAWLLLACHILSKLGG